MLSERITALFTLLQCSNTDIARYAGCSSGNISKLKTGNRTPKPESRSISVLLDGVYRYADYENMLTDLKDLCGSSDTSRGDLIPHLHAWLFETDDIVLPAMTSTPKSKKDQVLRKQRFGDRLNRILTLLNISNAQFGALLNIDVSLVSRYRSGIYSPHRNEKLSDKISEVIVNRAVKTGKEKELAALCEISVSDLDAYSVSSWLYNISDEEDQTAVVRKLLISIDSFIPGKGIPEPHPDMPDIPEIPASSCYYGTEGLRNAVIRFLSDSAKEGGELLLYSDEPMDWMSGDADYFTLWASLMVRCINCGVKIKIIHNVDRTRAEMADAIIGWLPLYISGMIEPFIFRKERSPRFYHTVFLRSGGACIYGFFPSSAGTTRWYEYITDTKRLGLLRQEYDAMLSNSMPFLKIYNESAGYDYRNFCSKMSGKVVSLLTEFPVYTMPEKLLERIVSRAGIEEPLKQSILDLYSTAREKFRIKLMQDTVNLILYKHTDSEGLRKVNFGLDLFAVSVNYTQEEYAEHIAAVTELVRCEKNFHLVLLDDTPFKDIQISLLKDAFTVLRCQEPYTAFVFFNQSLSGSVSDYLSVLIEDNRKDRLDIIESLKTMSSRF